jgi:hypothetical protein
MSHDHPRLLKQGCNNVKKAATKRCNASATPLQKPTDMQLLQRPTRNRPESLMQQRFPLQRFLQRFCND